MSQQEDPAWELAFVVLCVFLASMWFTAWAWDSFESGTALRYAAITTGCVGMALTAIGLLGFVCVLASTPVREPPAPVPDHVREQIATQEAIAESQRRQNEADIELQARMRELVDSIVGPPVEMPAEEHIAEAHMREPEPAEPADRTRPIEIDDDTQSTDRSHPRRLDRHRA